MPKELYEIKSLKSLRPDMLHSTVLSGQVIYAQCCLLTA